MTKIFFEIEGTNKAMCFDRDVLLKDKFLGPHILAGHRILVQKTIHGVGGIVKIIFKVATSNKEEHG